MQLISHARSSFYPAPAKVLTSDSTRCRAVGRCNCLRIKVIELRYRRELTTCHTYLPSTNLAIVASCMFDVPS